MTRLPDLERELVAAAQRRYAAAPRRRLRLGGLRVLLPAAALLLAVVVIGSGLRGSDPEIEAPAGKPTPPAQTDLQALVPAPLGAAGQNLAAPDMRPVVMKVEDAGGSRRTVVAFADPHMNACLVVASGAGGAGCSSAGMLRYDLERRDPAWELEAQGDTRVVYGLVGTGARAVEVELGSAARPARIHDDVFVTRVTEEERRSNEYDGERPALGDVRSRLFAVAFTSEQVPGDPDATPARLRVTYADGKTVESELPRVRPAETAPGCYREASLDTDVAVPDGAGSPVEICTRFWRETGFEGAREPERLTACEGGGNSARVFPGGPDVCARLGLEPYR